MLPYILGFFFVLIAAVIVFLLELPWWIAAVIAVLVGGVLFARWLYRFVIAKQSAKGLEKALMAQSNALGANVRPDQQAEIVTLQHEFHSAIESLKTSRLARSGGSALYALPWYAIIGPPGAGKSTALRASGLTFPQMAGGKKSSVRGIGGTRNCDWWLTNEAVLLDTAGRYTTEDDDRDEWFAFLDLLKKHRARKPLNGIMVAVSVTDVALATDEQLATLAERIRERLDEVIGKLGVVVPVYLVFTKCDLISGFVETFEDLPREERAQVLGFTLPVARRGVDADEVAAHFDRLSESVRAAAFHRMGAERRLHARERVFVFAQEFERLRDNVTDFVSRVFVENVYHDTPVFRGAYFTSGTQEGRPIERVLSAMTGALGAAGMPATLPASAEAKSYFLGELFTRVMFPDAELTFASNAREKTKAIIRYASSAAVTCVAIAFAIATASSYVRNRDLLLSVRDVVAPMTAAGSSTTPSPEVIRALSPMRDRLAQLRRNEEEGVPASMRLGLYRGEKVLPLTQSLYGYATRRALIEPMTKALSRRMTDRIARFEGAQDRMTASDHTQLYDDLREYLLLTEPKETPEPALDEELTTYVTSRLIGRWTSTYAPDATPALRTDVEGHVRVYLSIMSGDRNFAVRRDAYLVRRARQLLGRTPPTQVAVDRIVSQMDGLGWDLTLASILGTTSSPISGSARVRAAFTRRGWEEVVRPMLDESDAALLGDPWVVEMPGHSLGSSEARARRCAMQSEYYGRLIDEWKGFLGSLRVSEPAGTPQALTSLQQLTRGDPPPFERIMRAVAYHTELPDAAPSAGERLADAAQNSALARIRNRLAGQGDAVATALGSTNACAGGTYRHKADVVSALSGFYRFAVPATAPAGSANAAPSATMTSIQIYHEQLEFVRDALRTYLDAPSSADALLSRVQQARTEVRGLIEEQDVGWRSRFDALLWPPILAASNTSNTALVGSRGVEWCSAVARPFGASFRGRYPFDRDGQDAPLSDFAAFYKPTGGTLWGFYDTALARDISRMGGRFSATSAEGVGSAYGPQLISFLEKSLAITEAIFPAGATVPRVEFEVRVHPTPGVATTTLIVDDQRYEYRNGPEQWTRMHWPGEGDEHGGSVRIRGASIDERIEHGGEWGLFRLLDSGVARSNAADRSISVAFRVETQGVDVVIDIRPSRTAHPFAVTSDSHPFQIFRTSGVSAPRSIGGGQCPD